MLHYREIRPRAPVARFVECFWTLTGLAPASGPPERILPDGCMELVLNCGAPFRRYRTRGAFERQPLRMLVGQMDHSIQIQPTGRVDLLGIRFHPAGARAFLRMPMSELAGHTFALEEVAQSLDRELAAALDGPAASRAARVEALLERRIAPTAMPPDAAIENAVARLMHAGDALTVDSLAADAGISPRQLERRFLDAVGLGPKRLARILRFQRVFRAIESEPAPAASGSASNGYRPNWAAVAVDCGYYDQAHLIRDFHQFAGQTPSVLLSADAELTRIFTRSHRSA